MRRRTTASAVVRSARTRSNRASPTKDKIAAFKVEDPREELLKYDKLAREDPIFVTPAYAVNQPQTLTGQHLAKTVDEDDEPKEG